MSKHRRPRLGRARSTIVKTAAAMGVATAIAAGAHSVSEAPPSAQASADPHHDNVDLSNDRSDSPGVTTPTAAEHHKNAPTDMATDSARAPQAVGSQQTQSHHTAQAPAHSSSAGSTETHSAPPAPAPSPSQPSSGSSTPSQPPASTSPAPSDPSSGSGDDGGLVGGVLGGVVGGVGGVVGGLLG